MARAMEQAGPARHLDEGLLDAAAQVIAEHGLHAATLSRVAGAADVSRVTLHRRGVTRDALVEALIERAAERYQKALWAVLTDVGTPLERLRRALEVVCEQAEAHLALLLGLRAEGNPHLQAAHEEVLTRPVFTDPIERLLRDGVADGSLDCDDPPRTATLLFNMVGWSYVHLRSGHRWTPDEAASHAVDLVLRGVVRR